MFSATLLFRSVQEAMALSRIKCCFTHTVSAETGCPVVFFMSDIKAEDLQQHFNEQFRLSGYLNVMPSCSRKYTPFQSPEVLTDTKKRSIQTKIT